MDNLLENKQVGRLIRNSLLSQKRFNEASGPMTEEMLQGFIDSVPTGTFKRWYVNGTIELGTFEAILEYKFDLVETI